MPLTYFLQRFPGLGSDCYHFEAQRYASFINWPHDHSVSVAALSKSGWYSPDGIKSDETTTFCCNARHGNWTVGDSPWEKHKEISPDCQIARGDDVWERNDLLVFNIPIPVTDRYRVDFSTAVHAFEGGENNAGKAAVQETDEKSDEDVQRRALSVVAQDLGVTLRPVTRKPARCTAALPTSADGSVIYSARYEPPSEGCFPSFASLEKRVQTFRNFPAELDLDIENVARQGFFYADYKDYIICYKCGLGLYELTPGDDPGLEHARLEPFCSHFRSVIGSSFILEAQRDMEVTGH